MSLGGMRGVAIVGDYALCSREDGGLAPAEGTSNSRDRDREAAAAYERRSVDAIDSTSFLSTCRGQTGRLDAMKVLMLLALSGLAATASAIEGQQFEFSPASTEDAALDQALPALAREAMAVYQDSNQGAYLGNLFRLQLIAGAPEG